jgi:uncharacterized coiled-coil DUF342 family protein
MKYYSEVTKKMYKTVDELNAAEKTASAKHDEDEEKRKDIKEVEDALRFASDAYDKANEKLVALTEKYGVVTNGDLLDDLFELLL